MVAKIRQQTSYALAAQPGLQRKSFLPTNDIGMATGQKGKKIVAESWLRGGV